MIAWRDSIHAAYPWTWKAAKIYRRRESSYLISRFVRDKDSVSACAMIAEVPPGPLIRKLALWFSLSISTGNWGSTRKAWYRSLKKGQAGAEDPKNDGGISAHPMLTINNSKVIDKDFLLLKEKNLIAGTEKTSPGEIKCLHSSLKTGGKSVFALRYGTEN